MATGRENGENMAMEAILELDLMALVLPGYLRLLVCGDGDLVQSVLALETTGSKHLIGLLFFLCFLLALGHPLGRQVLAVCVSEVLPFERAQAWEKMKVG